MPCMKCSNGKWKYGEHGRCQFDTLAACKAAAAAIHVHENTPQEQTVIPGTGKVTSKPFAHDTSCMCYSCAKTT